MPRRRPARSPLPMRTSLPGRRHTSAAARSRSPSCASRTGSADPLLTCRRCGRLFRYRCSPRTSSSNPGNSTCSGPRAPTSSCCSPCSTRDPASGGWSIGRWRSASSRWSRRTTSVRWTSPWRRAPGSSGSTTATFGRWWWIRNRRQGSASGYRRTGSWSRNPGLANRPRCAGGGRSGSMRRSSAKPLRAPWTPRPPPEPSSPPGCSRPIQRI